MSRARMIIDDGEFIVTDNYKEILYINPARINNGKWSGRYAIHIAALPSNVSCYYDITRSRYQLIGRIKWQD